MSTDAQIEAEIQAKGKTAARVTPADIEANIVDVQYFTAANGIVGGVANHYPADLTPYTYLTFCVILLRNGFTVTGESACASPENFDTEIGQKIARANAVQKIWPLMGYALKDRLASEPVRATPYTWADVATHEKQLSNCGDQTEYFIRMRDGATFRGFINNESQTPMIPAMVADINRQAGRSSLLSSV